MALTFKLAFRNLWRNRRRTLITAASIMFATFFAISMSSLQKGTWQHTLEGLLHNYTGYIQIHAKGYWENQSIDLLFDDRPGLKDSLQAIRGVNNIMSRIENFALLSTGPKTRGVLFAGIQPSEISQFTDIEQQIEQGRFLQDGNSQAVMGKDLADVLGLSVGDTLIAISQGYRGNNAVGQYPISGFVDFGNPQFNKQLVYITLDDAQEFFAAPGLVSSLVITTDRINSVDRVAREINSLLDTTAFEVMTYEELLPALIESKALDEASSKIIMYILYVLIGFGILGTVIMMLRERQYEFGVLKAIGMKFRQLFSMVFMEVLAMGLIGVLAGIMLSLPVILYLQYNPIHLGAEFAETYEQFNMEPLMKAIVAPGIFIEQAIVVFLMVTLISLYPYFNLRNLKPVEAMRS